MTLYDYNIANIDLRNKTVLDCAIGAGESTYYWASEIHRQGGTSKIHGYDISLTADDLELIERNLKEYAEYVEIEEKDISELNDIGDETVDYINCDDTLVFLANSEGLVGKTLEGFHRVLRRDGMLVINSENPIVEPQNIYERNQCRRWNFSKGVFGLNGELWSNELSQGTMKRLLTGVGFRILDEYFQEPVKQNDPLPCIKEWEGIMKDKIMQLIVSDELKACLNHEVESIKMSVMENGMACPGYFSIRCNK